MPKSLDLPVFNYARVGAERMARRLGNVEVIWRAPENADQLRQKEILESFITQRVDGIAISCLNRDFLTQTIERDRRGIPVVTWEAVRSGWRSRRLPAKSSASPSTVSVRPYRQNGSERHVSPARSTTPRERPSLARSWSLHWDR
jgi:hypothetical protein